MKQKQKPAQHTAAKFTEEELGAMKSRVKELKAAATKAEDEKAVVAAIAGLQAPDRALAKRLDAIIKASAPALSPKTWYGMPAYAKDGNVVCFFQSAAKFKARYATLGFTDKANIDDGEMWPTYYGIKTLTAAHEAKIARLMKKAVS